MSQQPEQSYSLLTKLIEEICFEKKIKFELLSYDYIMQLTKDNKIRHIIRNNCIFDLNPQSAGKIASDKYATYEVLKSNNIPIINHKMIFNPAILPSYIDENGNWPQIIDFFYKNHCKVVVKPNYGSRGFGVYLCETIKDLEIAISTLFKDNNSISLCPYYDIKTEYRTFYIDGNCELIYGKHKPYIIGNGKNTVSELISIQHTIYPDNVVVDENLKSIDLNYIPKKDEKVLLSWKHNLSGGALPQILEDNELKNKIETLVKNAAKAMNIKFATIDVIQTSDNKLYILEVNSGVAMTHFVEHTPNGYDMAKKIYSLAVDKMFEE